MCLAGNSAGIFLLHKKLTILQLESSICSEGVHFS